MKHIYNEITPLGENNLYFAKHTPNDPMEFPLHSHTDYELTLVKNVNGKRIIGNSVEQIINEDLALIGPDTIHGYKWDDGYKTGDVCVIQFSKELASFQLISKFELKPIYTMLTQTKNGISFSAETIHNLNSRITELTRITGIKGVLLFLEILYELSISDWKNITFSNDTESFNSNSRINKIIRYVEKNYMNEISLTDIGELVNMPASSVCRYFKSKTAVRFWDYLNNYRIDKVINMMMKNDDYISMICFKCGFNNLSNFNRAFKKRLGMTPREYRDKLKASAIYHDSEQSNTNLSLISNFSNLNITHMSD